MTLLPTRSFGERFEDAWRNPSADGLVSLLSEDVVLYQPHLPPIRGREAARREFERLFAWSPGARSEVKRWREQDGVAFIEHELIFPVGRRAMRVRAVDCFTLEGELATERVVYFNMLTLVLGVLRHPSLWPGFVRYRLG